MVAEWTFPCCKRGHPWTQWTVMMSGGRRRCRVCHNARTNAFIKKRYRIDSGFRKKVCARANARHKRLRNKLHESPNLPPSL